MKKPQLTDLTEYLASGRTIKRLPPVSEENPRNTIARQQSDEWHHVPFCFTDSTEFYKRWRGGRLTGWHDADAQVLAWLSELFNV